MFRSSALRPLRRRDFAFLFFAGLVSNIGSWMQTVAVGTFVVDRTGKAAWAALVAAGSFLPIGALSPVGGALADRLDRKRFLILGYLAATTLAGLLALLSAAGRATPASVLLVVFLGGSVAAFVFPFQQAILPELVPKEELLAAISLGSAEFNFGRIVGPALAGLVIAVGSYTLAFLLNAISFLAVVLAVALIRIRPPRPTEPERIWTSIRRGAQEARRVPGCRSAIGLIGTAALLVSPFIALIPAMANVLVDGGKARLAAATGTLVTAQGVGAVLGALALAPLAERLGRRRALLIGLTGTPIALVLYASSPSLPLAAAALLAVGALYIAILSGLGTVVQVHAPDAFRGRILSLYFVALGVVYPIGALIQGWVADRTSLRVTTAGGAGALLVVVLLLAARRPGVLTALDDPIEAGAPSPEAAGAGVMLPMEPAPSVDGSEGPPGVEGFPAPTAGRER